MKKMILCLSVAISAGLASCGGGGPEADAQKMCDLMSKAKELKEAGKMDEIMKLMEEVQTLGKEMEDKYKDDAEAKKTIEAKVKECSGDMM